MENEYGVAGGRLEEFCLGSALQHWLPPVYTMLTEGEECE
jgi:hypothetical protein